MLSSEDNDTIAILGGGLTGLTLADLLNSKDVLILEKENECGGLCRSVRKNGYTFDPGGSHIIFSKDTGALEFMKNALGDNICLRRRNTKILYKGKLVKYPFENGLSDLPKQENFECLLGFLKAYIERNSGAQPTPDSFKAWMYCTFGPGITEKYLLPYNTKIWKLDPGQMDLSWVDDRAPQPSLEDIIKASLGLGSEGYVHQLQFYYPREGGIQALVRSLEEKARERAKIVNDFKIASIKKTNAGWLVSDGSDCLRCREVISTIPLFDLVYALEDVPGYVKGAVDGLKYNSLITVMIGIDSPDLNDLSWLYIPDGACLSHRVSFPSNYSDKVAPSGKSSALAEITYREGDHISYLTDEEIIQNITGYLQKNKIISKGDIEYTEVKRTKYAYVVNDLNYKKNVNILGGYLKMTGIHPVGRFSEWEYYNMDACIRSAMDFVSKWGI